MSFLFSFPKFFIPKSKPKTVHNNKTPLNGEYDKGPVDNKICKHCDDTGFKICRSGKHEKKCNHCNAYEERKSRGSISDKIMRKGKDEEIIEEGNSKKIKKKKHKGAETSFDPTLV